MCDDSRERDRPNFKNRSPLLALVGTIHCIHPILLDCINAVEGVRSIPLAY
jgi:hypothetical protein